MNEYPKIETIFKRDERGNITEDELSLPELEYLKNNLWVFTEKVDGTNIRVMWDGERVTFGGKTDNAQIPATLVNKLQEFFPVEKFSSVFPNSFPLCLYGEGYGLRIQDGKQYNPTGVDFTLFDVLIKGWWLNRENITDIAKTLGISVVPIIGEGSLLQAVELARQGFQSAWGPFTAEGIVLRPKVELLRRNGERIITKIKHKDFSRRGKR